MYKLFVMISMVILLTGCNCEKKDKMSMDTNLINKVPQVTVDSNEICTYSDEQLSEISAFIGTKDDILSRYHTGNPQIVRILQNPNDTTSIEEGHLVVYRGKTKVLILTFDSYGNKLSSEFHNMTVNKNAFDTICIGSSLLEVQTIDPSGGYLFLYTGTNKPRVSTHYTTDGFLINIMYDKNNIVEIIDIIPLYSPPSDSQPLTP